MNCFKQLPTDILSNILEYDGRWKRDGNKLISIIHPSDSRYNMLNNLIMWNRHNTYSFHTYNHAFNTYVDVIKCIFTSFTVDIHDGEEDTICIPEIRYVHVYKYTVYEDHLKKKCKFNIFQSFTTLHYNNEADEDEDEDADADDDYENAEDIIDLHCYDKYGQLKKNIYLN